MIDLEASRDRLHALHGRVRERRRLVDLLTGRETADVPPAENEFSPFDDE